MKYYSRFVRRVRFVYGKTLFICQINDPSPPVIIFNRETGRLYYDADDECESAHENRLNVSSPRRPCPNFKRL